MANNSSGIGLNESSVGEPGNGQNLLVDIQWKRYQNLFTSTISLYCIALFLLLLKESPLRKITRKFPESLLLILCGLSIGAVFYFTNVNTSLERIDDQYIINFFLPPIILDSAYHIYTKQLLYQLDGVLAFAVVGTAFNILALGFSLYGVYGLSNGLDIMECLLFSSIVSAVDPVAVLAVFNQLGVSFPLYIIIFGESLLNDGITIVFFETVEKLAEESDIKAEMYAYVALSFFTVSLGGFGIGFAMGILSALACRCTSLRSRMLEPLIILLSAYMSFILSQMLHWSGFIALIVCGLTQKRYAFPNLFEKTRVTVVEGTETIATMAESLIFLLLGVDCYLDKGWNPVFICWTLLFMSVYRVIGIFVISKVLNTYRQQVLTYRHMAVLAYSGLRGAVSYALAVSVEKNSGLFVTTTLAVIFFTVFIQGGTVRFVVMSLDFVEKKSRKNTFTCLVMDRIVFHSVAGMEAIMGGAGTRIHYWVERLEHFDKRYFRRFIVIPAKDLSGLSDFLHHKELHKIYRIHNVSYRTKKNKPRKDNETESSSTSSHYSSQTVFSSSGPAPSLSSRGSADSLPPVLPRSSHSYVKRIRRKLANMTPSKRHIEKAKKIRSYEKNLGRDHIRQTHSLLYRKHHLAPSVRSKAERNRLGSVRRGMFNLQLQHKQREDGNGASPENPTGGEDIAPSH